MKKLLIASFCLGTLLMTACKKEKQKTTQEKLEGRWKFNSEVDNEHYNNSDHITTKYGTAEDYVDINSNGKMYSSIRGKRDTSDYKILSDQYLLIESQDSAKITTLTESDLVLYGKEGTSTNYFEQTTSLKK